MELEGMYFVQAVHHNEQLIIIELGVEMPLNCTWHKITRSRLHLYLGPYFSRGSPGWGLRLRAQG